MVVWKFRTTTFLTCSFFWDSIAAFFRKKEQAVYEMDIGERVPSAWTIWKFRMVAQYYLLYIFCEVCTWTAIYVHRHLNLLGMFCHLVQLLQVLQQLLRFVFEPVGISDKLNSPTTSPIDIPYLIFQAQVHKLHLYFHTAICYYLFSHSLITSRL